MKKKTKKLALESIMFSMDAMRVELEATIISEEKICACSQAVKTLAEAYKIIKRS